MKRKSKLFYSLPLLLCGALLFSCGTGGDNIEEEPNDNNDTVVPGDGTIAGAGLDDIYDYNEEMDGSTRPNYEDIFDYESEYEPEVPDPTGTVNVTFVLPDGVTLTDEYKNYYSEVEVYGNVYLPTGESEYLNYTANVLIEGWATYSNTSDTYTIVTSLPWYSVGRDDVTLYAYVSDSRGYEVTEISRADSSSSAVDYAGTATFNDDGSVADVDDEGTPGNYSYKDYFVNGKLGKRLTYDGTLEDAFARFLSVPAEGIESFVYDTQYDISYTLYNFGSETLTIQISQIPSLANYTAGVLSEWYELESGDSVDFTLTYTESRTSGNLVNMMTGFVVKGEVNSFDLGVQMAIDYYYDELDPDATTVSATYVLPDNVSLSTSFINSNSTVDKDSTLTLPIGTDSDLVYSDVSRLVEGWALYNASTDSFTDVGSSYNVGRVDIVLYAYTNDSRGYNVNEFTRGDVSSGNAVDWIGTATIDGADTVTGISNPTDTISGYSWKTNYVVDGKMGGKLTYSPGSSVENPFARFLSTPPSDVGGSIAASTNYDISYTFVNYGTEEITIQVSQIRSSYNYAEGIVSDWYTIQPNESVDFALIFDSQSSNNNMLTGLVVKGECSGYSLGVQLAIKVNNDDNDAKLTLGNDHVYTSDRTTEFDVGDAPANSDFNISSEVGDRTLQGWYYDTSSGRVLASSLNNISTTTDLIVYPYFSEYSGYTKVEIASGHWLRKNNDTNTTISTDYFEAIYSDTAVNGDNGVAELGSSIVINTSLTSTDYFRFDTTATDGMTADKYSFIYSFENYGSERISFTIYQVNSGRDTSTFTGDRSATVTLDPGCYGTVQLVATSTGTNSNLLSYFEWGSSNISAHFKMSLQYRLATEQDVAKTELVVIN